MNGGQHVVSFPRSRGCRKSNLVGGAHPTSSANSQYLPLNVGWAPPTIRLLRHPQERGNEGLTSRDFKTKPLLQILLLPLQGAVSQTTIDIAELTYVSARSAPAVYPYHAILSSSRKQE